MMNSLTIDTSSFTGLYLKGIPVLVEAIPNPGYRFSHWLENANENARLTISLLSDTLLTAVFVETRDFDYSSISINEVYNRNSEAIKGSIEEQEWIEIHNSSDESIDLAGLFLSDNEDLTRWMFPLYSPEKTTVPAQGFISIFGDVNTYFVGLEANFKSIKTNDVISLTKVIGKDTTVISTLTVPDNAKSNGRYPDGSSTLRLFSYPTYVSTNSLYLDCNEDEKGGAIIDECGVCAGGNTQILIDDCVTAIEEDLDFSILTAYPNPVLSDVYLNHNITWLLTDIHGIEIDRGMSSSVDMSRLTNGIYFLKTNLGQIKLLKY